MFPLSALVKMLDSFAVRPGQVRADPARNLLLIQGTGPERRNTMETALSFDVDWMRGQSVGIFPIQYSNPEPIIAELEKILDAGDGGLSQGNIKFQVMARMNGILVVTKKPDLLKAAETWIKRLDTSNTNRTGVHVYRVNYGEAKQVAKVLNDIFVGGGAGGSFDTPSSTAPRSSSERLSLGGSQSGGCRWWCREVPASGAEGPAAAAAAAVPRRDFRARSEPRTAPTRMRSKRAAPAWEQAPPRAARRASPRRRPDHLRRLEQFAADLCEQRELPAHPAHARATRPAAIAGRHRRHRRRGQAQRHAGLRRPVLPAEPGKSG